MVYFVTHAIPHPFWSIVIKGAMEGARDACLEYKWTQDVEFSPTTTVERQEMAITERPDVLVITAVEPKMQQRTIKRAREAGIPTIAINVEDPGPDQGGLDYLVYIGGDEEKGGYAAAAQIVKRGVEPKRAACFNACLSPPPDSARTPRVFVEFATEPACARHGRMITICYPMLGDEPMVTINVRRLDEDVVDRLKRRASSNNRSLEGEARHILQSAADDDMAAKRAAFLEASDWLRQKTRVASKPRRKC